MKPYHTILFYKYTHIEDVEVFNAHLLAFCRKNRLYCRIYTSSEGINGSVSDTPEQIARFKAYLAEDSRFDGIEYKTEEVDEVGFDRVQVKVRPFLVNLSEPFEIDPNRHTARHLTAEEVLQLKDSEDFVMLDVRNKVEWEVGKFKNAYTMDIDTFREFPEKVKELEELKNKKVIAYCTGGIRCEKATVIMEKAGFKEVYQIDGGILKYAQKTGGKDFDGKLYVFDKRVTSDINNVNPTVISECRICGTTTAKMVNCANPTCNEHFVMCDECGWKMEGCCSTDCQTHPQKREYDGTGYYSRKVPV